MQLRKAIALFLGEYKASTRKAYQGALLPMQDWIGPARELSDLKAEHVLEFFQYVIDRKGYSPATRQKHVKTVKTFFNWCVRYDFIQKSPAVAVRGRRLPRTLSRDKAMTDDELHALLEFCKYKPRNRALLLFLADTGCRRAGAAGVRINDLDFKQMRARVTEKGEHQRLVSFGEKTAEAIRHWLAVRSEKTRIKGFYVFSIDGRWMNPELVSQIIRRDCLRIGLRSLGAHSLRHRKGHQFADARIAPSLAATALGHADVTTTIANYYPGDYETAEMHLRALSEDNPKPGKIIGFPAASGSQ